MELDIVKQYLKIDCNDDDEIIKLAFEAAKEYVTGAIGECDLEKARVKILVLTLTSAFYEKRAYTEDKLEEKTRHTISSMLLQLRTERIVSELESD